MSETASDEMIFATESFSKRGLRNVTKMTGTFAANVARDTNTAQLRRDDGKMLEHSKIQMTPKLSRDVHVCNVVTDTMSPGTLELLLLLLNNPSLFYSGFGYTLL